MISRRKLLWGGLGVVGIAGLGLLGLGRPAIESKIVSVLRKRLSYLTLDEAGLRSFASDQTTKILAKRVSLNRMRYHLVSTFGSSYKRFERSSDTRSRVVQAEDLLVSTYLLSSDFFINGSAEARTVQYLAYYDPMRPCGNPFARPAVDTIPTT